MHFKIGDQVRLTGLRDINCPPFERQDKQAGQIGTLTRINVGRGYHGPYEVSTPDEAMHYCKEEEIEHVCAPRIPYDQPRTLPRYSKWMPRPMRTGWLLGEWKREVR